MDLIDRQKAIDAVNAYGWLSRDGKERCKEILNSLPSAEPEPIKINIDHELTKDEYEKLRKDLADAPVVLLPSAEEESFEWCTDCKEYDQSAHCCHRWTKVIRNTVEEIQNEQRWIPVSERLPSDDGNYLCWYEYYHYSKEKVLPEYGIGYFNAGMKFWGGEVSNGRCAKVLAWMPLPEPYKDGDIK